MEELAVLICLKTRSQALVVAAVVVEDLVIVEVVEASVDVVDSEVIVEDLEVVVASEAVEEALVIVEVEAALVEEAVIEVDSEVVVASTALQSAKTKEVLLLSKVKRPPSEIDINF